MRTMPCGGALLCVTLALAPSLAVLAQAAAPERRGASKARPKVSLEEVAIMLAASEEDEVRSALEAAALLPAREVIPLIEERVRGGLTLVLLDVSLDTLLLLADPSAGPLLFDLARHRRPTIRARALDVLARLKVEGAEQVATRGLADLEPEVRKAAAEALGILKARGALEPLVRAFELGVEGAARAIGQVASSADVARLLEYVGNQSPSTLTPLFEELFARRDIADAEKLRSAERIAALNSDEAREQLAALLAALPRDASGPVRRALTQVAPLEQSP